MYRNIEAAQQLFQVTRTSLGPNGWFEVFFPLALIPNAGMNKMVINHLEKLFVTNDAATIMKELEVVHPAARLLVMASQQQELEVLSFSIPIVSLFELFSSIPFLLHDVDGRRHQLCHRVCG